MREYNLKWNFFDSHSDADLERQFAADRVWGRPTRRSRERRSAPAQPHAEGRAWQRFGFDDPMELLGDKATLNPGAGAARGHAGCRRPSGGRSRSSTPRTARPRPRSASMYKALVKDLHPDMNGGRRDDEARLTEVVWAWEQIKASRSFRD